MAKKLSKGKKVALIIASVILVLLIAVVCVGISFLNSYCEVKDYTIINASQVNTADKEYKLVAHRGYSAIAPENTAPAYEKAGEQGFWGAECDIYRTADGVWILTHDISTYRMMDKSAFVEKKTYEELKSYTYDNGSNIGDYTELKICTLDEYLEICKENSMNAVIELKGKNNTEHYDEIIEAVEKAGMSDYTTYISFHYENLQKIRSLCDAPVLYLVQEITDEDIELALALGGECGINFNGNKEENTDEIIKKCVDSGLIVAAWTIDTKDAMERLVKNGVSIITTNCIIPQ